MKSILTPTNFSKHSDNAIDFAVQLARVLSGEITILNVFELKGKGKIYKPLLEDISNKLSNLKNSIEETTGLLVNTDIYEGAVAETIVQAAEDKKIDCIAMGTLGSHGIRGRLLGSETAAVIGRSYVPVIVVPFKYKWKKPHKILLATKHFEKEPAILDFLFKLAESLTAEIHVVVFSNGDRADIVIRHTKEITEYEEMLKERYAKNTLSVAHLSGAPFKDSLQGYINQNEIDLLAMVTYKRSILDMIFNPSVTRAMSYYTKIPLLAIPARELII